MAFKLTSKTMMQSPKQPDFIQTDDLDYVLKLFGENLIETLVVYPN